MVVANWPIRARVLLLLCYKIKFYWIKQLFHSRLSDMRKFWPTQRYAPLRLPTPYSYINPTRTRGIMVNRPYNWRQNFQSPAVQWNPSPAAFGFSWVLNILALFVWSIRVQTMTNCCRFAWAKGSCSLSPGYRLQLLHSYIGLKNERATPFLPMQRRFRRPVYFFKLIYTTG